MDKLQQLTDEISFDNDFIFVSYLDFGFLIFSPHSCDAVFESLFIWHLFANNELAKVANNWSDQREVNVCSDEVA